jgi:hypothetical protein
MNDANAPTPPVLPTPIRATPAHVPLGTDPAELEPITGLVSAVEAVLRQPRRVMYQLRQPGCGRLSTTLVLVALVCSLIYGVVVGTFSGGEQLWAAPVKIAVGLLLSALICLPSLYIFSCLGGSQARLAGVAGLVTGTLALTTVLLIGFAPVAWVFSQSTESVAAMGALHLVFGGIAAYFGLRFLHAAYVHLDARSTGGLKAWMLILILVVLQMTTALRPIVGKAETFWPTEKRFFLTHWVQCLK